ncbi:sensor histidine kinase [Gordonia amarae]|uniref:sensor histidine kinase n=1 Tax=Gordonia amarae TaxID=36821 RepID=UPI001BCAC8FB|nr:histidine kinase [Gordonia amarae]
MRGSLGTERVESWQRSRPWLADGLLAVALGVLLIPSGVGVLASAPWPLPARAALIAGLVALHILVVFRRVRPRATFVAGSAVLAAFVCIPDATGPQVTQTYGAPVPVVLLPSSIIFCVLLYSVAAHRGSTDSYRALAVAAVGGLLVVVRLWNAEAAAQLPLSMGLWRAMLIPVVAAFVVVPWQLGRLRQVRARYLEAMADRALADERRRIAGELHDVVSHSLAVMVSQAEGARMLADRKPGVVVPALDRIATTGQEAMHGMRALLDTLDPDARDRAPQPTPADLDALLDRARRAGLDIHWDGIDSTATDADIPAAPGLVAYRVVQESVTNVLKHAGPQTSVTVVVRREPAELVVVEVADDGGPILDVTPGRGLLGMRERVEAVGGRLTYGRHTFRRPHQGGDVSGFAVRAHIPTGGVAS